MKKSFFKEAFFHIVFNPFGLILYNNYYRYLLSVKGYDF
jgi:hypothetical protein